ncbi:hypothetical protein C8Q78DRAFT_830395 [Trametes maxima]|nr:hypothetical protein C8Q78DRAFT_830395 [Trametes maxima]
MPSATGLILASGAALGLAAFSLAASTSATADSDGNQFNWDRTKYVYAFGDSYTFVQGTKGLANFSFIGDAFHLAFTPEDLLEDEIVLKNTSSDGANWIEFLTGCVQGKPSSCSPHQLWDFAFAGADVDKALLPLHHNFTVDLVDEVKQWVAYASDIVPHPPAETLVAWWIGINDTGDTLNRNDTGLDSFWEHEMQSLFGAVQNAYDHDLRGTYLFINVPPMERSPDHLGTPIAPVYKQRILDYNAALAAHAAAFAQAHPDVTVLSFDAHGWFNAILDTAAQHGFTNITGFCECKDPEFFWFNTGHPTEHVHRLLAGAIEAELRAASSP